MLIIMGCSANHSPLLMRGILSLSGISLNFKARRKFVDNPVETNVTGYMVIIYKPLKDEAQTALFKDPVRTAL